MKTRCLFLSQSITLIVLICALQSCKKSNPASTAFYYWKSNFSLDKQQIQLLKETGTKAVYLRFFDIAWDDRTQKAYPDAVVSFASPPGKLNITPVIFISNKTFEQINVNAVDSLAIRSGALIDRIAAKNKISYKTIQVDCDWTLTTREKYFNFLRKLKLASQRGLEATIRLHQVKYKERTGVPPVEMGVLMFYNMGKLTTGPDQPNSIYNETDAEKYVSYIPGYPLRLDVALPLFSWAIAVREGRIIQLYSNLGEKQLSNSPGFDQTGNSYRAKKSFFFNGIYVKENDIFKVEQTDIKTLQKAAKQLSANLPSQKNRTIIYYELGNLNQSEFSAQKLNQVSADL